jgi:lipoyl(octanoyl) transferase
VFFFFDLKPGIIIIMLGHWRLLITPPAQGAWNMALDEALLSQIDQPQSLPVLRLYAWQPACLSLGQAQSIQDVDAEKLVRLGWCIVRRPTGGKAVLHTDELTYSIIAPLDNPIVRGTVLESYNRIAGALMAALALLQLDPVSKEIYANQKSSGPVCFEMPSNYEITVGGKKLIGSAQARQKEGVLQHGSLPLFGDLTRITQCLRFSSEEERQSAANRLLKHATTIEMVSRRQVSWQETATVFISAFQNHFGLVFEELPLTAQELALADKISREKYANGTWTTRK